LFVLNGVIWLVFSIRGMFSHGEGFGLSGESVWVAWVISGMMAANAVLMLLFAWRVPRGGRLFNLAAVAYITLNAILSITDEAGLYDYLVLGLNLALLILLLIEGRKLFRS
jgi:hypothetical protein